MEIIWKGSPNFDSNRKPITMVVLHWFGMGTLEGANATFQKPSGTSAHYGISDTRVWQWVKEEHVAYHAGNYVVNQKSIGIEHDANPDKLLSEASYQTSGRLVAEICKRYNIPLDRTHIIKHSEVPRNTQCSGSIDIDKIIRIAKGENMPELIQIEKKDFEKLIDEANIRDAKIVELQDTIVRLEIDKKDSEQIIRELTLKLNKCVNSPVVVPVDPSAKWKLNGKTESFDKDGVHVEINYAIDESK